MSRKLTPQQQRIFDMATRGHNLCILGRAGVGKSVLVNEIKEELHKKGQNTEIICSSRIACESFEGMAKTVHSQFGLQTAELPARRLIERCLDRKNVIEDLKD